VDWAAVFAVIQSWGPSAISSVLVAVVLYLIRQVGENGKKDAERAEHFRDQLDARVKEVRGDINKTLLEHDRKISYIEMEYIKRDTFHRELSGWKEDINRLSSQINTQFTEFMTRIIEIWKGKK
jgi:hypothetical protein